MVASLDLLILRSRDPDLSNPFLYCLMRTEDFTAHIKGHANGTTVLHLSNEGVPSYRFAKPANLLLKMFNKLAQPLFEQIDANVRETETLTSLRDTLLPKLLSGELRVKQAEKLLKTA